MRLLWHQLAASTLLAALFGCGLGGGLSPPGQPGRCDTTACESGATLTATLMVPVTGVFELVVEACRNEVCVASRPSLAQDGSGSDFLCAAYGPLTTRCHITADTSAATAALVLVFTGRVSDFVDGDHYVVRVSRSGLPPLLSIDKTVSYTPNSDVPGCEPRCLRAIL